MEVKINKEIRDYRESIFFGLSTRQFFCSLLAVMIAMGIYFILRGVLGKELLSWLCIVAAMPVAVAGFFKYNGLTFEQYLWAFVKTHFLRAGQRVFRSENVYYNLLKGKDGR